MPAANKRGPSRYTHSKQRVIRRAYAHGHLSIGAHDRATRAHLSAPYCRVCGENHANPCVDDDLPEPGEMRETG